MFIGSLIFVQELAEQVKEVVEAERERLDAVLIFPSMPEVMRLNKVGGFTMASLGQSKSVVSEFMKKKKADDGSSFEEAMLKLLRTLPKVLKYLPGLLPVSVMRRWRRGAHTSTACGATPSPRRRRRGTHASAMRRRRRRERHTHTLRRRAARRTTTRRRRGASERATRPRRRRGARTSRAASTPSRRTYGVDARRETLVARRRAAPTRLEARAATSTPSRHTRESASERAPHTPTPSSDRDAAPATRARTSRRDTQATRPRTRRAS